MVHFNISRSLRQTAVNILKTIFMVLFLSAIGYVFLYPIFVMISTSFKDISDIINPAVNWIPSRFYVDNYVRSFQVLQLPVSFFTTTGIMALFSAAQTMSTALIGYGLAKFDFKLKPLFIVLILAGFIIPSQVTMIPQYILFNNYKLIGTIIPHFVLALTGQGIKSAIFILIFFQFFRMIPKSLDEAAQIDGASKIRLFFTINLRLSVPAIVITFVFSFVWYWNETYLSSMYFGDSIQTLPLLLENFVASYSSMFPSGAGASVKPELLINNGTRLAGTLLSILPLIVLYSICERKLVDSIDRVGITGE